MAKGGNFCALAHKDRIFYFFCDRGLSSVPDTLYSTIQWLGNYPPVNETRRRQVLPVMHR